MTEEKKVRENEFWAESYARMDDEVPQNEKEKKVLKLLGEGHLPIDVMEEVDISHKEMMDLLDRAKEWEIEHMCDTVDYK